jgi:uncharacterized protein YggE
LAATGTGGGSAARARAARSRLAAGGVNGEAGHRTATERESTENQKTKWYLESRHARIFKQEPSPLQTLVSAGLEPSSLRILSPRQAWRAIHVAVAQRRRSRADIRRRSFRCCGRLTRVMRSLPLPRWLSSAIISALATGAVISSPVAAEAATEPTVQPSPSTIRVVAQATVTAKPDEAELYLGVTTANKTATAAVAANDRKMAEVLAALKKEVGADGDVKTTEVSVQPRFAETRSGDVTARLTGYTVTNTVEVRTSNVRAVGRLLDVAFGAGANTVEQVGFTLKDPEAVQNQALRAASAKARARAAAIADAQGLRVGDVMSMTEGDRGETFLPLEGLAGYRRAKANEQVLAMAVEPGSVEVVATVTVIFALKAR